MSVITPKNHAFYSICKCETKSLKSQLVIDVLLRQSFWSENYFNSEYSHLSFSPLLFFLYLRLCSYMEYAECNA